MRIMRQLTKKLILNTSQKRRVLYSTKMTIFSAVVVEDVIRVILTKNDVFQKSVGVISIHWVAKVKQSSQVQRSTSRKYVLKKEENVVAKGWTNTEHFIIDSCCA